MRTVTSEIQLLYEENDGQLFPDFSQLVNGIREHVDRIHTVCRIVKDLAPESILDVGCNRGLFGALVRLNHGPVKRVVGVDISRLSTRFAREMMGYDTAHTLNASEPFSLSETFDLALCMEILEHVPSPEIVVENVASHLKPGAFALFSCPNEFGDLDGEFHVRRVSMNDLERLVSRKLRIRDAFTLASAFCEKPKWGGWHFVIATKEREGA